MVTVDDVILAYRRLKSYVYHENSLQVLMDIALFEDDDIDKKLNTLHQKLLSFSNGKEDSLDEYLSRIKFSLMPKTFAETEQCDPNVFFYTNKNKKNNYPLKRLNAFIDCPIEIHIVAVLWITKIGVQLDTELGEYCYGNRLQRNSDNDFEYNSIKLFKKYYINYSEWRDRGIKTAKDLHDIKLDVAILNIDIKNYYHSIDYDLKKIDIKILEQDKWLNFLLQKIHNAYTDHLVVHNLLDTKSNILPIGLLSSTILANYYLIEFDAQVKSVLNPAYYGRYVDDIIIVFSNPKIQDVNVLQNFIDDNLIIDNIPIHKASNKEDRQRGDYFIFIENNKLFFQTSKVKLYNFYSDESIKLLEKFEAEIKKNSSEFRYEPESNELLNEFAESSYKLNYSDTINKFRSVDSLSIDKLGISKHLSKLISSTKFSNEIDEDTREKLLQQVSECFSGLRGLQLNSLWEKVYNLYTIHNAVEEIIKFTKEQITAIKSISYDKNSEIVDKNLIDDLKESLLIHLANCFAMSCSLNRSNVTQTIINKILNLNPNNQNNALMKYLAFEHIEPKAKAIIKANLLRHHLIYYPLLNYCQKIDDLNFLSKELYERDFVFDEKKIKYSPRFIHYNELSLFYQFKNIFVASKTGYKDIIKNTFRDYIRFNTLPEDDYKSYFPRAEEFVGDTIRIIVSNKSRKTKLKVGLVNSKTILNNSISSMKARPILNYERFDEINHILNESLKRQPADLIIFPEISVPYQWLPHLTAFSKTNNVAIICGLEHLTNKQKEVLNYVAVILPFKYKNYNNAVVDLRLKKDYSPEESKEIEGRKGFKIPIAKMKAEKLRLFKWNNIFFSVFNCFELADISKRAKLRGKVDFVVTVEYNRDTNYFSNITDSIARDIHAYIIQVNTSEYGDSRITQPSNTHSKDLLKIKGGENVSLITSRINIKELRDFQQLNYSLQEGNQNFKYTPPNFEMYDRGE